MLARAHQFVLLMSTLVVVTEISALIYYRSEVVNWVSHNLWIVIVPFLKTIIKKLIAMKFVLFFKALGKLLLNLLKLLLLKIFKTLTIRYGVFFSQFQWRWIRWCKVMFLRTGRRLFRSLARFWAIFSRTQKWFILIAFFPIVIVLFLLGLSFNVTRKTMVQKTQETAVFKTAMTAGHSNTGLSAWVDRVDRWVLHRIKRLTAKKTS